MLRKIQLTNFKRHEALTIEFADGLTALKGSNEAGKSTLIHAITYALFGTKALSSSLEDTVTYGKPVNTLKVVLDFVVDGVEYRISRGKSGAEITYDGGTVTGQNETAAFVGRILGTDAQVAPKLILANQNEIRGALGAGAKATTELIEKLAEFDQLDNLIDLIQAHLVTGSTVSFEATVESAKAQLQELQGATAPDTDSMRAVEAEKAAEVSALASQLEKASAASQKAAEALSRTQQTNSAIQHAERAVEQAHARLEGARADLASIGQPPAFDQVELAKVEADLRAAAMQLDLKPLYDAVKGHLNKEPTYGGTFETLEREIDQGRRKAEEMRLERARIVASVETMLALKVAGSCSLCGKDVSEVPEVLAKNAKLDAEAQAARDAAAALAQKIAAWTKDEAELQAIKTAAKPVVALAARHAHEHLKVDSSVTPPVLNWTGPTDFSAAQAEYDELKARQAALQKAARDASAVGAALHQAQRRVAAAEAELATAQEQLGNRKVEATEALQKAKDEAAAAEADLRAQLRDAQVALERHRSAIREAVSRWESHMKLQASAEASLRKAEEALHTLQFNNGLLKAVRSARPVIADKLWSLVLGAVSRYFSEMRGSRSLVTKTTDGFVVDGHSAATLSGSTLDILGLAVRVALVKTFVPHAALLVLDEPTAAMDVERTAITLGFLAKTGFRQTIIVSHEEATEAVADNLIEL